MIDLILTEDCRQFQELTRNFALKEITPHAHQFDHDGKFPREVFDEAAELGLTCVLLPEEFGGAGLSLSDACVIVEELAVACCGTALTVAANLMGLAPLLVTASKSHLAMVGERLSSGGLMGWSMSRARVAANGSGTYVLSADNLTVLNGDHAEYIVVPADDSAGNQSIFLLHRNELNLCGALPRFGLKCADIALMQLEAPLTIPSDRLVGAEGEGALVAEKAQMIGSAVVASCAAAIVRAALEHSLNYSKERQAFGQPISSFQSIAFMMADMARSHQAARLMTWRASRLYDAGTPDTISSLAAAGFAVDAAMSAATDAVQIFGGYGYSKEYPVEKLMRDAKLLQMLRPTSHETRVLLGRELLTTR